MNKFRNILRLSLCLVLSAFWTSLLVAQQPTDSALDSVPQQIVKQIITQDSNVINIIINNQIPTIGQAPKENETIIDKMAVPPSEQKKEEVAFNPWDLFSSAKIITAFFVLVVSYFTIAVGTRLLYYMSERSSNYRITIKGFVPIFRIMAWSFVIYLLIAGVFQPPFQTIVALATSFGLAVGFASQDILKNIFGGLMILLDRPFIVGDKIEVANYYGEVVEIGLRSTRIVTPDDSLVSIPNSEMMNSSLSNSNAGETNCQVVAEIYLPITVNTQRVREIALESARVSSYVFLNKPITILFFNEVKERRSYLKMRLKAYVMDIRHEFVFKSDMTEIVIRELLKEGIIKPNEVF